MTTSNDDTLQLVDAYQTELDAGTYEVSTWLQAPADLHLSIPKDQAIKVRFQVAGPRFFLPASEIHSVFPAENGVGDYNNVLPHVVLNRRTLPWERLVADLVDQDEARNHELKKIPFLALLLFTEEEEAKGEVTPPMTATLEALGYSEPNSAAQADRRLEPGEKPTDKVSFIEVKPELLQALIPTGEELCLLAHGREQTQQDVPQQRAVIIANRLPQPEKRHTAHLVMLEDRYQYAQDDGEHNWLMPIGEAGEPVRLICLKSWQFTCAADKPTLTGRLLGPAFTFEPMGVPKFEDSSASIETIRAMGYAALPYQLRWGDRAPTLYRGPLVATSPDHDRLGQVPISGDALVRLLTDHQIFDVSLAAAWQLGQLLMLQDSAVAMAYFSWRERNRQRRAKQQVWASDGHLQWQDEATTDGEAMPTVVQTWFQERQALRGIPFEYWVPDGRMLPENSLRVFHIHKGWMEAFVSGAIAIGRAGAADLEHEIDHRQQILQSDRGDRSGFLLRSPAVEDHPDLEVAVYDYSGGLLDRVRVERIGPGVMLGLYEGILSKLTFSLPPLGLYFGFKEEGDDFLKDIKREPDIKSEVANAAQAKPEETGSKAKAIVGANQVVKIHQLRNSIAAQLKIDRKDLVPHRFAFQMLEGSERVEFEIGQNIGQNT